MRDMVLVSGGEFLMGADGSVLSKSSRPVHRVTVSSFSISRHPVTQQEWQTLMPGHSANRGTADRTPSIMVSWIDAIEHCLALTKAEGLLPWYRRDGDKVTVVRGGTGYRLPTEAEWEYAARGGSVALGTTFAGSDDLYKVGWCNGNSRGHIYPVCEKSPNELGLFDMSGNVWEWCWDWYGPFGQDAEADPAGPAEGAARVYRGGSWVDFAYGCSVYARGSRPPTRGYNDIGLRVARTSS